MIRVVTLQMTNELFHSWFCTHENSHHTCRWFSSSLALLLCSMHAIRSAVFLLAFNFMRCNPDKFHFILSVILIVHLELFFVYFLVHRLPFIDSMQCNAMQCNLAAPMLAGDEQNKADCVMINLVSRDDKIISCEQLTLNQNNRSYRVFKFFFRCLHRKTGTPRKRNHGIC